MPILLAACETPSSAPPPAPQETPQEPAAIVPAKLDTLPPPACDAPLPIYEGGRKSGEVCEADAAKAGVTIVDLSDAWAPRVLGGAGDAREGPSFRATYLALANEELGTGPEWDRPRQDRFLELYGVFPSIRTVRARLLDDARHRCRDGVGDAALARFQKTIDPWEARDQQRSDVAETRKTRALLEAERKKRKLASIEDLRPEPRYALAFAKLDRVSARPDAVTAAQEHLRCEGLLGRRTEDGVLDVATTEALKAFQRKQMIVSWSLDEETRNALLEDSREGDLRTLLRVLRERVADATGLIEDGSAAGAPGLVAGRVLDAAAFRAVQAGAPLPGAAPDLLSSATDVAARALGWTSPEAVRVFFEPLDRDATRSMRVALRLPPLPDYHGPRMDLRAEVDRGDVWYDFPYTRTGLPMGHAVERRPTMTLFAKRKDGTEVPLVRWGTTIGGWKVERLRPREMALAYKESPAGERVWRDVIAAPVWIPPESAPKRELVRPRADGSWATKQDLFGPGYASAYGLVMMVHHRQAKVRGGPPLYRDEGIRTHGSVSYDSIQKGTSHGCHRLYNHMAVRLASFLLAHRPHVRHGSDELGYGRRFNWEGKPMQLSFDSRGYRYELDPPVPVEVLRGRVMGKEASAPAPRPLPEPLAKRFIQERFEE